MAKLPRVCARCGVVMVDLNDMYCEACLLARDRVRVAIRKYWRETG